MLTSVEFGCTLYSGGNFIFGVVVFQRSLRRLRMLFVHWVLRAALRAISTRRNQQADEQGDDRDHHQQFHQGKTLPAGSNEPWAVCRWARRVPVHA